MAARLSVGQIYNAARKAGFAPARAAIATAIALAESGGDPGAHCDDCFPGVHEDSRGLWQINVVAHPQMAGWNLYDPATNARAAFAISNGGRNFTPWSTYGTGPGHTNAAAGLLPKVYKEIGGNPPDTVPGADVPAGGSSSSGGATDGQNVSDWWKALSPFGWGFGALSDSAHKDLAKITLTGLFTVGGIGLVVLGVYKGVSPTVQRVKQEAAAGAAQVAKVAAL